MESNVDNVSRHLSLSCQRGARETTEMGYELEGAARLNPGDVSVPEDLHLDMHIYMQSLTPSPARAAMWVCQKRLCNKEGRRVDWVRAIMTSAETAERKQSRETLSVEP